MGAQDTEMDSGFLEGGFCYTVVHVHTPYWVKQSLFIVVD